MSKEIIKVDERLRHIAFIMDGNGRWATSRNMPREEGHKEGVKAFINAVEYCRKIGIEYITVYAFSTENWKRPKKEVDAIMALLEQYLDSFFTDKKSNGLGQVRFIGDTSVLSFPLKAKIKLIESLTAKRSSVLNVAVNYGSRLEITAAVNRLIADGKTKVSPEDIDSALYTGGCPDPDLIVRTGGDLRISNFLLWQAAYSELYFTDTLWPDFGPDEIDRAVAEFYSRKRRFGGLDKNSEKKG